MASSSSAREERRATGRGQWRARLATGVNAAIGQAAEATEKEETSDQSMLCPNWEKTLIHVDN